MRGFFELALGSFGLIQFMAFCMYGATIARALQIYAAGVREVLEERKHQRQIELMEMDLELERFRHGKVTDPTCVDCGGACGGGVDRKAATSSSHHEEGA
jgi:hypothetical protein